MVAIFTPHTEFLFEIQTTGLSTLSKLLCIPALYVLLTNKASCMSPTVDIIEQKVNIRIRWLVVQVG